MKTWQLLTPPPVYEEIVSDSKHATHYLRSYLTSLNDGIAATLKPVTYTLNGQATTGMVVLMPNYTTDQINSIQNPINGMVVYDTTANKFKFYENGSWVEYT